MKFNTNRSEEENLKLLDSYTSSKFKDDDAFSKFKDDDALFKDLSTPDHEGLTLFVGFSLAGYHTLVAKILSLCTKDQKKTLCFISSHQGISLLHSLVANVSNDKKILQILEKIINSFDEDEIINLLNPKSEPKIKPFDEDEIINVLNPKSEPKIKPLGSALSIMNFQQEYHSKVLQLFLSRIDCPIKKLQLLKQQYEVKYLMNAQDGEIKICNNMTLLHMAVFPRLHTNPLKCIEIKGSPEAVREILSHFNESQKLELLKITDANGNTPLHLAVECGHVEVVKEILLSLSYAKAKELADNIHDKKGIVKGILQRKYCYETIKGFLIYTVPVLAVVLLVYFSIIKISLAILVGASGLLMTHFSKISSNPENPGFDVGVGKRSMSSEGLDDGVNLVVDASARAEQGVGAAVGDIRVDQGVGSMTLHA